MQKLRKEVRREKLMACNGLYMQAGLYATACLICGRETARENGRICRECLSAFTPANKRDPPGHVAQLIAPYEYSGEAARLMRRFKYEGHPECARALAHLIELPPDVDADCIVPVPLHPRRLRERGYDQTLLIARELSRMTGLPVETALVRRAVDTPHSAGLSYADRQTSVRGAFECPCADAVSGRHILIVDDVITTGATIGALAAALSSCRAGELYAAAVLCATSPREAPL